MHIFGDLPDALSNTFLKDDRWKYLTDGLSTTLIVTFFAVILGMVLGFLIAIVRATHDKNGKLGVLNFFAKVYLTVIRGTPVVVQLLILYFIIFATVNIDKTLVAILAFGLNSAAYVAEIVRSGIMSIDNGQFEAGASLGLNSIPHPPAHDRFHSAHHTVRCHRPERCNIPHGRQAVWFCYHQYPGWCPDSV